MPHSYQVACAETTLNENSWFENSWFENSWFENSWFENTVQRPAASGQGLSGVGHCGTYSCGCLPMAECGHRLGELNRVRGGAVIRCENDVGAAPALPIVAQ